MVLDEFTMEMPRPGPIGIWRMESLSNAIITALSVILCQRGCPGRGATMDAIYFIRAPTCTKTFMESRSPPSRHAIAFTRAKSSRLKCRRWRSGNNISPMTRLKTCSSIWSVHLKYQHQRTPRESVRKCDRYNISVCIQVICVCTRLLCEVVIGSFHYLMHVSSLCVVEWVTVQSINWLHFYILFVGSLIPIL